MYTSLAYIACGLLAVSIKTANAYSGCGYTCRQFDFLSDGKVNAVCADGAKPPGQPAGARATQLDLNICFANRNGYVKFDDNRNGNFMQSCGYLQREGGADSTIFSVWCTYNGQAIKNTVDINNYVENYFGQLRC